MKRKAKKQSLKTIEILDAKGQVIHSMRNLEASKVDQVRRGFYRVLIQKLKIKATFKVKNAA